MTLLGQIYTFWAPRRRLLFSIMLLIVLLSTMGVNRLTLEENVSALLPDGRSEVAVDFALLSEAPFARKVLISLSADQETDGEVLTRAADGLAEALGPPWFGRTSVGPGQVAEGQLLAWLTESLPLLLSPEDLTNFGGNLRDGEIEERLREVREQLLLPEGWVLKELLRRDPLGLHLLGLEKLRHLNLVPQARLKEGRFVSADGRHALVIAETDVEITDSAGGSALLAELEKALSALPAGVSATVVSGHRYSVANAGAIRNDLARTLGASFTALVILFIVFLRHWRGLFPFLVPLTVVCLSAAVLGLAYSSVSAVTLGFGAVLLGISVDFALHVYFALRRGGGDPAAITAAVARPVLFGGITTIAAFAVLLGSELPGQRQLAVFAITGLGLALFLSLIVLPHLVPPAVQETESVGDGWTPFSSRSPLSARWVIGIWGVLLILALVPATQLRVDGDLRRLSLVPQELREAESELAQKWGDVRGNALVFAEGADLDEALAVNARLFDFLEEHLPGEAASIAPVLPPFALQRANRQGWEDFWRGAEGGRITQGLHDAAERVGFSPGAFAPFTASLSANPSLLDPGELRRAGLGEIVDALVISSERGWGLLSLIPDTPETAALFAAHRDELPGVRLVSQARFGEEVSRAIGRDFARFLTFASLTVTLLVSLLFRRVSLVLLALVPVATGLTVMFGIMGGVGLEFTLLNVIATVLVIGLCVDYGIFMVCRISGKFDHATDKAVLVSGLTTLAGFGALVLARHPALNSIGITVLLGIGAAIPAALLVIPAFARIRK